MCNAAKIIERLEDQVNAKEREIHYWMARTLGEIQKQEKIEQELTELKARFAVGAERA